MEARMGQFRRAVLEHFGGRPGRGARYPAELRRDAVELARASLSQGQALSRVAAGLGLGAGTLGRWLEAPVAEVTELRPVEVVAEASAPPPEPSAGGSLILITAGGHRVEGLGVDELVRLLEALG